MTWLIELLICKWLLHPYTQTYTEKYFYTKHLSDQLLQTNIRHTSAHPTTWLLLSVKKHLLLTKLIYTQDIYLISCFKQTSAIHLLIQPHGSYSPLKKLLLLTKLIYAQDIYLITCFKQTSSHVVSWFLHLLPAIQLPIQPPGSCSPIRNLATTCFWPNFTGTSLWLVPRLVLLSTNVHCITTPDGSMS